MIFVRVHKIQFTLKLLIIIKNNPDLHYKDFKVKRNSNNKLLKDKATGGLFLVSAENLFFKETGYEPAEFMCS
jgi:hypothetical protein